MAQGGKEDLVARFDYYASESHELTVLEGDHLTLLDDSSPWWKVKNANGEVGYVPSNYVRPAKQNLLTNLKNSLGRRKGNTVNKTSHIYSPLSEIPNQVSNIVDKRGSPNVRTTGNTSNGKVVGAKLPATYTKNIFNNNNDANNRDGQKGEPHIYHSSTLVRKQELNLDSTSRTGNSHANAVSKFSTFGHRIPISHLDEDEPPTLSPVTELLYRVIASYRPQRSDELLINPGDRVRVLEKSADGWWFGEIIVGRESCASGWFPSNYVVPDITNGNMESSPLRSVRNQEARAVSVIPAFPTTTVNPSTQLPNVYPKVTAVTLFPFVRSHLEELSFNVNEILEVLERPSMNTEWLRCRNARGDVGWVPTNHLRFINSPFSIDGRKLSDIGSSPPALQSVPIGRVPDFGIREKYTGIYPDPQCLESPPESMIEGEAVRLTHALKSRNNSAHLRKPWFWGNINQTECEYMLRQYSNPGDFIIRDSTSTDDLTIVLNSGSMIRNFRIAVKNGCYHIGTRVFRSVEELIFHFQRHYIYTSRFESCFLVRPFSHPGLLQSPWYAMNQQFIPPIYTPVFRPYETVCGVHSQVARTVSR